MSGPTSFYEVYEEALDQGHDEETALAIASVWQHRRMDEKQREKNRQDERAVGRFLLWYLGILFLAGSFVSAVFYNTPPGQSFGVGLVTAFLGFVVFVIVAHGGM